MVGSIANASLTYRLVRGYMTRQALNAYFLDHPLSDDEVEEVEELTGFGIVQVRIPHVLPTPVPEESGTPTMPSGSDDAPLAALKAADRKSVV